MLIDKALIREVKEKHDLVSFIEGKGIQLKRAGKVYQGLCPFHDDTNPSLVVDPEKQLWNCLGACSAQGKSGGDLYAFVMKYDGISFREAHKRLGGRIVEEPSPSLAAKERTEILTRAAEIYHQTLLESTEAQDYLKRRGLVDPAIWKAFQVGYGTNKLLSMGQTTKLKVLGLVTRSGRERFSGCMTIPLLSNGAVTGLYGRKIQGPGHYYLPGPRRGLVNARHAARHDEILLTESILDALSFIQAGITNVLPLYGTNGLTSDHLHFLEEHQVKRVILCLDADTAGERAAKSITRKIEEIGIETDILTLPAKDPNDLLVREGPETFSNIVKEQVKKEPGQAAEPGSDIPSTKPDLPIAFADDEAFTEDENTLTYTRDGRKYVVQGMPRQVSSRLKVNIRLDHKGRTFIDRFDLYASRARQSFINRVAALLEENHQAIEEDLLLLIQKLEERQKEEKKAKPQPLTMTKEERDNAVSFLQSPGLFDAVARDMEALGYVGEETNKRLAYLVSISRKLPEPLSMVILSQSGSGKSALAELVEEMTPPEDVKMFSRLTPQALYYLDRHALQHKLVIIEERSGSESADYSIRTLQSKKKLTLAAPLKDPSTGKIQTVVFEILGPTAFIESTTAPSINIENATRCFEVYLDESPEQTHRIHAFQKQFKTEEGLLLRQKQSAVLTRHHHAQRLLKPMPVVIPFAPYVQFPHQKLRTRRDHQRFLNLIEVLTFLHQYRRETRLIRGKEVVVASIDDYAMAVELARDLLTDTFRDVQKPLRDLLGLIEAMVKERARKEKKPLKEIAFTRRDVREYTGLPHMRVKRLFSELEEYEYLMVEKGKSGTQHAYRLVTSANASPAAPLLAPGELANRVTGSAPVRQGEPVETV